LTVIPLCIFFKVQRQPAHLVKKCQNMGSWTILGGEQLHLPINIAPEEDLSWNHKGTSHHGMIGRLFTKYFLVFENRHQGEKYVSTRLKFLILIGLFDYGMYNNSVFYTPNFQYWRLVTMVDLAHIKYKM
jgi:hypothetical protein